MSKTVGLPQRRTFGPNGGFGNAGRKIALKANFFPVQLKNTGSIFHYDISVVSSKCPDQDLPKKVSDLVVRQFLESYKQILFKGVSAAYDGRKNIYTSTRIPESKLPKMERREFELDWSRPGGRGPETFIVALRFAQSIDRNNIQLSLNGKALLDQTLIQALDVVLMDRFKSNDAFTNVGRNFYAKQQERAKDLGCGKEIWFGFHQSLRPTMNGMMLNIDVAATTFYKGQNLVKFAEQIVNPMPPARRDGPPPRQRPIPAKLDERLRRSLEKELKHVKIETRHGKHYRNYRILKLLKDCARSKKFEHDGAMITVARYFEIQYQLKLNYPELPLALMGPKEKNIFMPLEVCWVIGGEHYKKKLGATETADMVRSCAKPAPERLKTIDMYARNNHYESDPTLKGFDIKVNTNMVELEGRVLPSRNVQYSNNKTVQPRRGAWEARNCYYIEPKAIQSWAIFCTDDERYTTNDDIRTFGEKIIRAGKNVGMKIPSPPDTVKYLRSVRDLDKAFKMVIDNKIKFVVLIIGRNGDPFYNRIKQLGDIIHGVHTQCFKSTNLRKANDQLMGNLLLKINAKFYGVNNIVRNPDNKQLLAKPTMIIGADVTHPAPGDSSRPSIAALVASMDSTCTKYAVDVRVQNHRQEMIGSMETGGKRNLELATVSFLKSFYQKCRQKPGHIIYYRDGVSEGQFQDILKTELQQLRKACSLMPGSNYRPNMTVIICQKRHHARLFCKDKKDADGRSENVPAGTIVDKTIVHPSEFDFYLCSHAGIQGTSRPTHYHVIYNDDKTMTADWLQSLTYNLTHVYQRCTRSVSLPAPVYYAHLAAKQATCHLNEVDDNRSTFSGDSDETFNSDEILGMQEKVTIYDKGDNHYAKMSQHYV